MPRAILRLGPWIDRAFIEGARLVRQNQVRIKVDRVAKSLAARARAIGIVEAEQPRFRLAIRAVTRGALERRRVPQRLHRLVAARNGSQHDLARLAIPSLDRIYES
jgi:hypothetical protein